MGSISFEEFRGMVEALEMAWKTIRRLEDRQARRSAPSPRRAAGIARGGPCPWEARREARERRLRRLRDARDRQHEERRDLFEKQQDERAWVFDRYSDARGDLVEPHDAGRRAEVHAAFIDTRRELSRTHKAERDELADRQRKARGAI